MTTIPRTGQITAKVVVWLALMLALSSGLVEAENRSAARAIPGAPERVVAVPLREAAIIAWLLPENATDAAPITGYTISAYDNDAPHASFIAKARAAGVEIRRLLGGHCYSFGVRASNDAGDGPESERSETVCLPAPGADLQLSMTAPPSARPGSELTFTLTVNNNGAADAALVTIIDTLPAPLAKFTTTQGICQGVVGGINFGCNLGAVQSGASATVTVSVTAGSTDMSNTAWASGFDAAGAALPDPLPNNNTATATVVVQGQSEAAATPVPDH